MKIGKCFSAPLLAACMVLSACSSPEQEIQYVRIEEAYCSFLGTGNEPRMIKVEASGEWTAEVSAQWIRIVECLDDAVIVSVDDNDFEQERSGRIVLSCGDATETVYVNQLGNNESDWLLRWVSDFEQGGVMSPGGRYVAGRVEEMLDDGSTVHKIVFIDLDRDERMVVTEISHDLFALEVPFAVTDDGRLFILDASTYNSLVIDIDGSYFVPDRVDERASATVQSVSADGSIWAGYGMGALDDGLVYHPIIWRNGEAEILPVPPLNFRGEEYVNGCLARGMNTDGSIIYGSTWDNTDNGMIYWKDGKVDYVGSDVHRIETVEISDGQGGTEKYNIASGMTVTADLTNISPNGKYIAGVYAEETVESGKVVKTKYPGFFNTETGKTTLFPDLDGAGVTATDDGIGFVTIGQVLPTDGMVVDIENGTVIGGVREWIADNFGMTVPQGYIAYVAPNGMIKGQTVITSAARSRMVNWYMSPNPNK